MVLQSQRVDLGDHHVLQCSDRDVALLHNLLARLLGMGSENTKSRPTTLLEMDLKNCSGDWCDGNGTWTIAVSCPNTRFISLTTGVAELLYCSLATSRSKIRQRIFD